jgi:hypothetical protein
MELWPSQIRYSQDSIESTFCNGVKIGKVLDYIYDGVLSIDNVSPIQVEKKGHIWYTADNRRLWVFQQLEKLGKCKQIHYLDVTDIDDIPPHRFTASNGGKSVEIRGDPCSRHAISASGSSMELWPSQIRYSHDSIGCKFQDGVNIGKTLDDIYDGVL